MKWSPCSKSSNTVLSSHFILISQWNSGTMGYLSQKLHSVQVLSGTKHELHKYLLNEGTKSFRTPDFNIYWVGILPHTCGHREVGPFAQCWFGTGSFQFMSYLKIALNSCKRSQHDQLLPRAVFTKDINYGCCSVQWFCALHFSITN